MTNSIHPACLPVEQLLEDCQFERTRRGGPGGQHRNKVESAIVVTHLPTGVAGQASERRSQHVNRAVAIERLRLNLALAVRSELASPDDPPFSPSLLWQSRSRGKKIQVNVQHEDYPALLSEALDCLASQNFDLGRAVELLGVSSSQLVKFLKTTPAAFTWLNSNRQVQGLNRLK